MSWQERITAAQGRMKKRDVVWLRAQTDVASAWKNADTPSRLCWVASLGTESDLLTLGIIGFISDSLRAFVEPQPAGLRAALASLIEAIDALVEDPGIASSLDPGEQERALLARIDAALKRSRSEGRAVVAALEPARRAATEARLEILSRHSSALVAKVAALASDRDAAASFLADVGARFHRSGDERIVREAAMHRAVVENRAEQQILVAAHAAARSYSACVQSIGLRVMLAVIERARRRGSTSYEKMRAAGVIPDDETIALSHSLPFEFYLEAMDDIVTAQALCALVREDERWDDAQLVRNTSFLQRAVVARGGDDVDTLAEDDTESLLKIALVPAHAKLRRAMVDTVRQIAELPEGDDERLTEWQELLAEEDAGEEDDGNDDAEGPWAADVARVRARMVSDDATWLESQRDVASAWERADSPTRLCWVAALGTKSDVLVLRLHELLYEVFATLDEKQDEATRAAIAPTLAAAKAFIDRPASSLHLELDVETERLLAPIEALWASSERDEAPLLKATEPSIVREHALHRRVIEARSARQCLVAARAVARSYVACARSVAMTLMAAMIERAERRGDPSVKAARADGIVPTEAAMTLNHEMPFGFYAEAMIELVLAQAMASIVGDEARWGDALLVRNTRMVPKVSAVMSDEPAAVVYDDDLEDYLDDALSEVRDAHCRALLAAAKATVTLSDDDERRVREWAAVAARDAPPAEEEVEDSG